MRTRIREKIHKDGTFRVMYFTSRIYKSLIYDIKYINSLDLRRHKTKENIKVSRRECVRT